MLPPTCVPRRAPFRSLTTIAVAALCLAVAGPAGVSGCRRSAPAAPSTEPALGELQVLKDGRFLFTYVEPAGTFATTDKPDIIPEASRKLVRVIDPGQTKLKESTSVYTTDINELLKSGKAAARPLTREAFETAAIAQLPPGASSPRAGDGAAARAAAPPVVPDAGTIASPPGKAVVTVYGTSWCGACRSARQYLSERKIPFLDKDIERDPVAARELQEKGAKMGIPTDRVPVLDVRGRLLLGFDPARVQALLGDPT